MTVQSGMSVEFMADRFIVGCRGHKRVIKEAYGAFGGRESNFMKTFKNGKSLDSFYPDIYSGKMKK